MDPTKPTIEPAPTKKLAWTAVVLAAMPFLGYAACAADPDSESSMALYLFTVALAVVGAMLGLIQILRFKNKRYGLIAILLGLASPLITAFMGIASGNFDMTSGRPLRRRGRARAPEATETDGWCEEFDRIEAPVEAASGWRKNAAMETASVAAFAHVANELLAIGAPPDLIAKAHQDALDELRHARLCYGIAKAIDGRDLGPAAFAAAVLPREGEIGIASVAAACVVEACVNETASARVAELLSARTTGRIREVLSGLATDEARHAEHGFEIVAYCLEVGGSPVLRAIEHALDGVEISDVVQTDDQLERYGIASDALWQRCMAEAVREARARLVERPTRVAA